MAVKMRLENVRLAFARGLWQKSAPPGTDADEKFGATFLLPRNHPQLAKLNAAIAQEAVNEWGPAKGPLMLKAATAAQKVALRDGDLKDYDGFADHWALTTSSFVMPSVFGANPSDGPISQDSGLVYGGCWVNAIITIKAYDNVAKGIRCDLSGVQKVRDDEALGGGKAAGADEFDEIAVESDPALA